MRRKKENIRVILVVGGIVLTALILIMANLTQDTYSATCSACGGKGTCQGTPIKTELSNTEFCPNCLQNTMTTILYDCTDCGIFNYTEKCYNSSCSYTYVALDTNNAHSSQPCKTCGGSGTTTKNSYHQCEKCADTGICPGSPERVEYNQSYQCPSCSETKATYSKWQCATCEFVNVKISCSCGYSSGNGTDRHSNIPCTTCNGTMRCYSSYVYASTGIGTHIGTCSTCGASVTENCTYGQPEPYNATYHASWCDVCGEPGNAELHADTDNDGYCDVCSYAMPVTHTHTPKTTWEKDANEHWKICSDTTCGEEIEGTRAAHSGGTHPDGKCTVCDYQYQTHTLGTEPSNYTDKTSTTHTPVYTCSCGATEKGTAESHTDSNSDGICDKCSYDMTSEHTHTPKTTWEKDANEHWKICSDTTCGAEIEGTRAAHSGGTHPDGKCTVCEYQYETHTLGTSPSSYTDKTSTTHTPVYTCSCGATEKGIAESHTDSNSDGICDKCSYDMISEHTHTPKTTWEKDANEHWKICSDTTCGAEIEGTRAAHTWTGWKDNGNVFHSRECSVCGKLETEQHTYENGKCTVCDALASEQEECEHDWQQKHDENKHWEECTECGLKRNEEEHMYQNGICIDCGQQEPGEVCEHKNREWKANDTEHWQLCKDCGAEIPGTREQHVYNNGTCKNCGLKDNTETGSKIPNTGSKTIVGLIIVTAILTTVGVVKIKKYKNI